MKEIGGETHKTLRLDTLSFVSFIISKLQIQINLFVEISAISWRNSAANGIENDFISILI